MPTNSAKHGGRVDYWVSGLLALALIPFLRRTGLPLKFDWARMLSAYWLVLGAQSIFVATLIYILKSSPRDTVLPAIRNKSRVLLLLVFFGILLWSFTWLKALVLTIDAVALLEFRTMLKKGSFGQKTTSVFLPALYLFGGLVLIFAYNDVILSVRFFGAYDLMFDAADRWLLHGISVPWLCHLAIRKLPFPFFRFLEFIYFGMFPVLGATLMLTSLCSGKRRGLEFVGAILVAYYIALLLFYLWPSQGPYYICPTHFSEFPRTLQTYATQKLLLTNSQARWNHVPLRRISTDYYIAFPCMHIAQPLIAMWFVRKWKRVVIAMALYDVLLTIAIILLEWHYVVDILAGVAIAALAIAVIDGRHLWTWRSRPQPAARECAG